MAKPQLVYTQRLGKLCQFVLMGLLKVLINQVWNSKESCLIGSSIGVMFFSAVVYKQYNTLGFSFGKLGRFTLSCTKKSFHSSSPAPNKLSLFEKYSLILTEGTQAAKLEQLRRCEENSLKDLKNREHWKPYTLAESTFTNPNQLNPTQYQFIVHSLSKSEDPDKVTLLDKPENIKSLMLSTSLINQETQNLFGGNNGLILQVPQDCVYAASHCDMWVHNQTIESGPDKALQELTRVNNQYGIKKPYEILRETSLNTAMYNEVLIMGRNFQRKPSEVSISGVFFKHRQNKIPEELSDLQQRMIDFAKEQKLPVLRVFEPIPFGRKKEIFFNIKSRITKTIGATEETVDKHLQIVEQYFEANKKLGVSLSQFLNEKNCAEHYEQIELLIEKSEYLKAWHLDHMERLEYLSQQQWF